MLTDGYSELEAWEAVGCGRQALVEAAYASDDWDAWTAADEEQKHGIADRIAGLSLAAAYKGRTLEHTRGTTPKGTINTITRKKHASADFARLALVASDSDRFGPAAGRQTTNVVVPIQINVQGTDAGVL